MSEGAPLTIKDGAIFLENLAAQSETRVIVPIVGKSVGTTLTVSLNKKETGAFAQDLLNSIYRSRSQLSSILSKDLT